MKIQCPYYELSLDDYSSPSFCSSAKPFHGRLSDIQSLIDALASDNQKGIHDELIAAFAAFQKGDHNVSLRVAYQTQPLLVQEDLIAYEDFSFENLSWEHINIWGSPRQLKASSVDVSQIVVRQGKWYIRCIRPVFKSLMYRNPSAPVSEWRPVGNRFWGYPHLLEVRGEYTYSRLFIQQAVYEDEQDAIHDLKDESKIDFSPVCDEIFGDG